MNISVVHKLIKKGKVNNELLLAKLVENISL